MIDYQQYDPLSYASIQNSISRFRQVDRNGFNIYDEPGTFWFKPIFYFYRSYANSSDTDFNNEGLLHPTWIRKNENIDNADSITSAYNYLIRNDEQQRATLLRRFIELLSNISSESPWYFQEISGLDNAVDHSESFRDGKFVADDRKQITITLLPDAIDTRIGTLLDLYRSVCYSWRTKREILPSNLRKFDMGIYVFNSMIQNDDSNRLFEYLGNNYTVQNRTVNNIKNIEDKKEIERLNNYVSNQVIGNKSYNVNNIYLEFINCEIDLSSTKGGDNISNSDGSERKYTLVINYDDCYVNRHNNAIIGAIGDSILEDILLIDRNSTTKFGSLIDTNIGRRQKTISTEAVESNSILDNMLDSITDSAQKTLENTVANIESATVGRFRQTLRNAVGGILLGNLYHGSLTTSDYLISSGRLDALGGAATAVTNSNTWIDARRRIVNTATDSIRQNLYQIDYNISNSGYQPNSQVQELGNLYRGASIRTNL